VARVHLCRSDIAGDDDLVHLRLVGPQLADLFPVVLLLANELVRARTWVRAATATAWGGLFLINLTLFAAGYWTD